MKLCAISFKQCWQDDDGKWHSSGGFPLQMAAIGSLFDEMTLLITRGPVLPGGIPLPPQAQVVPIRHPVGQDTRRKFYILANLPYYLRILAEHIRQSDVVHTPLPGDIPLLGMLIALILRKPLIARYGGSWIKNDRTTLMDGITKAIMRYFAGRGRNVMIATGLGDKAPAHKMHWLFSSALSRIEVEQIRPVLNRGVSAHPHIVYVGRISPEKGVSVLLRALSKLKQEKSCSLPRLSIAGDGPQREEFEQFVIENGCEEIVYFAGQLDRNSLSKLLLTADLCVQPSLTEGFSKAWLDALSHGLPVLTTSVGAAQNVIGANGERGWIVLPNDVNALADMLRQILSNPQLDWFSLRKRCREYSENLTIEAWSTKIGEICAQEWKIAFVDGKLRPC
jgi:glycosyltransferase involved in cell wall biosynthesis